MGGFLRFLGSGFGGFLGGGGEFFLNIDGIAGDVFAALTEEEPDKDENGAAKDE